jgi:hypothetical protein
MTAEELIRALPANDFNFLQQEACRRGVTVEECALALLEDELNRRRALAEGAGGANADIFEGFDETGGRSCD